LKILYSSTWISFNAYTAHCAKQKLTLVVPAGIFSHLYCNSQVLFPHVPSINTSFAAVYDGSVFCDCSLCIDRYIDAICLSDLLSADPPSHFVSQ